MDSLWGGQIPRGGSGAKLGLPAGWLHAAHTEHQFSEGCFVHWLSRACEM